MEPTPLIYECVRCGLREDQTENLRKFMIHLAVYLEPPYEGKENKRYWCVDCWRQIIAEDEEMRQMYADMALEARLQAEADYDNHDHQSGEHGCACHSVDDGFGRDE